jgi:PAS domain S-box-containing protein
VLLFGDAVNEQHGEQRAKDADLVEFFDNAPITLHWLSAEGIVLWANQSELDVLGYTAEEYIGQPVINFCPDDQELVLEIFKYCEVVTAAAMYPYVFAPRTGELSTCSSIPTSSTTILASLATRDALFVTILAVRSAWPGLP